MAGHPVTYADGAGDTQQKPILDGKSRVYVPDPWRIMVGKMKTRSVTHLVVTYESSNSELLFRLRRCTATKRVEFPKPTKTKVCVVPSASKG